MRLDYVVTLKNDYTREEITALTKSVDEAIFSHEAIEYPLPLEIAVDKVTTFEQEDFMMHYYKNDGRARCYMKHPSPSLILMHGVREILN